MIMDWQKLEADRTMMNIVGIVPHLNRLENYSRRFN